MRLLAALTFVSALSLVGCGGGGAILREPNPAYVPAGMSAQLVRDRIVFALPTHRWTLESEQANRLLVTYAKSSYLARVFVTYDAQYVYLQYADSVNLGFRVSPDGTRYIHPNYNRWVENLARDIQRSLSEAQPGTPLQVIVVPVQ